MIRLKTLERHHPAPRPQFIRQQRENTGCKPRPQLEAKSPDTLDHVGMVIMEGSPWCFPCQEPHLEHDEIRRRRISRNLIWNMSETYEIRTRYRHYGQAEIH
jgi:hypothetical protein